MELTEEDWKVFLAGAKQRKYKKGDYVLTEGMPTAALFQIVRGTLRVELQLKDQPNAVVVRNRMTGQILRDKSLLKEISFELRIRQSLLRIRKKKILMSLFLGRAISHLEE
mgnify:CR=1 FL=1